MFHGLFYMGWWPPSPQVEAANGGPGAVTTNVRNLYAAEVTGDRGTVDYFKWDPDSTDTALRQPKLRFTIKDTQYHKYQWIMRFRQTIGSGTWNWDSGWWSQKGEVVGAGPHEIDLSLSSRTGHLDADTHPWGTYTYDILFLEYEGETPPEVQAAALDWNFVKRYRDGNYKLWVPEFLPDSNPQRDGHDVWVACPEEGPAELRAYYCLEGTMDLDAEAVDLITLDPSLSERASLSAPTGEPEGHGIEDADEDGEFDGLSCYQLPDNSGGPWRVVVTARDVAGRTSRHWRTHDPVPMLAVNATAEGKPAEVWYDYGCGDPCGCQSYPIYWVYLKNAFEASAQVTYLQHFEPLVHPLDDKPLAGPKLTTAQQGRAVKCHVTAVAMSDVKSNYPAAGDWGGCTVPRTKGTPMSPDRVRFSRQVVWECLPDHADLGWGLTNTVLHELGHSTGIVHECEDDVFKCPMYYKISPHHYEQIGAHWSDTDTEHCLMHVNQIRKHLGWVPMK